MLNRPFKEQVGSLDLLALPRNGSTSAMVVITTTVIVPRPASRFSPSSRPSSAGGEEGSALRATTNAGRVEAGCCATLMRGVALGLETASRPVRRSASRLLSPQPRHPPANSRIAGVGQLFRSSGLVYFFYEFVSPYYSFVDCRKHGKITLLSIVRRFPCFSLCDSWRPLMHLSVPKELAAELRCTTQVDLGIRAPMHDAGRSWHWPL